MRFPGSSMAIIRAASGDTAYTGGQVTTILVPVVVRVRVVSSASSQMHRERHRVHQIWRNRQVEQQIPGPPRRPTPPRGHAGVPRKLGGSGCRAARTSGSPFHDLRRSAVRNRERARISRSVAMKMTGHKTESVYRRYAIVSESDLREAAANSPL